MNNNQEVEDISSDDEINEIEQQNNQEDEIRDEEEELPNLNERNEETRNDLIEERGQRYSLRNTQARSGNFRYTK